MKAGDKVKCIDDGGYNSLTVGKVYTVSRTTTLDGEPGIYIERNDGNEGEFFQWRFELVLAQSLMDDIEKAKALIGKKVSNLEKTVKGTVEEVYVVLTTPRTYSTSVKDEFLKFGYAVVVKWDIYHYGLSAIEEIPDMIEVPLTSDYTAKVYADKVLVGCQTITKETFDKVAEAFKQLNS